MPIELADVQAEVLTEAFTVKLENLVTKDYPESRLEAQTARLEAKIDADFRIRNWILGIITVAVLLPYFQRLAAL